MMLRIPMANTRASGLRLIASRETCDEVVAILGTRPRVGRMLWAKRAQDSQARINSGDIKVLATVVRDLQAGPGDTGRSYSQRNLFEMAIDRLGAEFAAVYGIEKLAAIEQLTGALRPASGAAAVDAEVDVEVAAA